jgi:hypothetical protein
MIEFVEHLEEVPDGSGDTVRGPDQEHLEAAAARIPKQIIETRELCLRVLVHTGYAQIKCNSFHICSSIAAATSRKKPQSSQTGYQLSASLDLESSFGNKSLKFSERELLRPVIMQNLEKTCINPYSVVVMGQRLDHEDL